METQTITDRIKSLGLKYKEDWKDKRVAIVEDTRFEQDVLQEMFRVLGFENLKISEFPSGETFLGSLEDDPNRFDVAILDGELRGLMSGPQIVLEAKDKNSKLKLVGRTARKDYVTEFTRNGAEVSILKDPRSFLQDFEKILNVFEK